MRKKRVDQNGAPGICIRIEIEQLFMKSMPLFGREDAVYFERTCHLLRNGCQPFDLAC
jgi:hypothetical protein